MKLEHSNVSSIPDATEELFDVVDQADRVLRQAPRSQVHANKWLHRASHIFVFNSRGELLIHRRSATKDECPLMFTSSASGHLAAGEGYEVAAVRELEEELGLRSPIEFLTVLPADGAGTSYEHSGLFRTTTDAVPTFDPGEIESGEYLALDVIHQRVSRNPELFTPCFRALFAWYLQHVGFQQADSKGVETPTLGRITIYPLKSFDPMQIESSLVLPNGALQHDRQFALIDGAGKIINAKRFAAIHSWRVLLDPFERTLSARESDDGAEHRWDVDNERSLIEAWFSERLQTTVQLVEDDQGGFPDDTAAPGPTVVSLATYQAVATWFPGMSLESVRLRFRANLEIHGVCPFWEDRLYGADDLARPFEIGGVQLAGTNPCQRCAVPTRDPWTGKVWPEFAKEFSRHRAEQLPAWAARDRFDHFYRLTVNTRPITAGTVIRVGDRVVQLFDTSSVSK